MKLRAVCIGKNQPSDAKSGRTGYFKTPQTDMVAVTTDGLAGDFIGDLEHHGGVDQAIYVFGEPDSIWWSKKLNRPCLPGFFGENLNISDIESATLCLGDMIAIGDVLLQITSPRIPCVTYASIIKDKSALKDFYAANRPGAYARVLRTGQISAGMDVTLIPFDGDRITVVENMQAYHGNFTDHRFLERALAVPAHYKLHIEAKQRLALRE